MSIADNLRSLRVGAFVECVTGDMGPGRLAAVVGSRTEVEYFVHPGVDGTVLVGHDASGLRRAFVAPQTRVHHLRDGHWHHGRVLEHLVDDAKMDVRFPGGVDRRLDESEIVIRWTRRLTDATELLAESWVESRRYFDARSDFARAHVERTSQYHLLSAISSSAIEAHAHQIEAVRRVLTDITPRYLLADEVGLGKTIEAGLLLRQHLLDGHAGHALAIVPAPLVVQWESELADKFRLAEQFSGRYEVLSFDELEHYRPAAPPSFLVVDEAHRLAATAGGAEQDRKYEALRDLATSAHGVLLLSATPLLQESASLLRLLHLLAPDAHPLENLPAFETALQAREEIATYFANLNEELRPVFVREAVAGFRRLLGDDPHLVHLLDSVEHDLAAGSDPAQSIRRARSHVTEVHRIHSRMIRTRRGVGLAEEFPVLGRENPRFAVASDSLQHVGTAFSAWQDYMLARIETERDDVTRDRLADAACPVALALSFAGEGLVTAVRERLADGTDSDVDEEEAALLRELEGAAQRRARDCPRIRAVVRLVAEQVKVGKKAVIAAGTEGVAAAVETALAEIEGQFVLSRIASSSLDAAAAFRDADGAAVLVFGPAGEEGQNLQVADVVFHLDVPWDPNRLEQRLGRFDRFGAGLPAMQTVLIDEEDTLANAWIELLDEGFGVFRGSIASLQLAIAALMPSLTREALVGGAEGLRQRCDWVRDELESELAAIEMAELLDETTVDDRGERLLQSVDTAEATAAASSWEQSVTRWASGDATDAAHLRFYHREENSAHRFALTRFENPSASRVQASDLPLVSWAQLHNRFSGAMNGSSTVGTFRRRTAVHRELRLFGPGDPFVDALWHFAEEDDRGRTFGLWRAREHWRGRAEAMAVCFDFRVRPDLDEALRSAASRDAQSTLAALRRRAESYAPPRVERVWLNAAGGELANPKLLAILNAPYSARLGDQTVRSESWHHIADHVAGEDWRNYCFRMKATAKEIVALRQDLVAANRSAAKRIRVDSADASARLAARREPNSAGVADQERAVGSALANGIANPTFDVDATGVLILSEHPPESEATE